MRNTKQLEDLAAKLAQAIPPGLKGLKAELEENFRAILRTNLERLDLVSRDRFDTQAELLTRTQTRLEKLERRLKALEQRLGPEHEGKGAGKSSTSPASS